MVKVDDSCSSTCQPELLARSPHICSSLQHSLNMNLRRGTLSTALTRSCNQLPSFFNLCWLYLISRLKPHGTAPFPRICLPSHQAKVSSAWQSGRWVSFPACPNGNSGPKVPLRCIGAFCGNQNALPNSFRVTRYGSELGPLKIGWFQHHDF